MEMEMSADWITIEKNKLDSLLYEFKLASDQKEVRVDITIDRDKEPYVKEFNELRWQGYNDFLKISSNKEPKEPDLSQEGFGEDNEKVGLVISDILGEYKFEKGIHNIVLYEKNIQKTAKQLKSIILLILRHLAVRPFPSFINRRHFPLETFVIRKLLNLSYNYRSFIKKLSDYFIYEYFFWNNLEEFKKGNKKLENEIELLPICSRELFDDLYEITFLHEVGHLVHHLLLKNYDKFNKYNKSSKEAFADLFSLYFAPGLKEKIIFFSLAQISDSSWFGYYKELNKVGKIFKCSTEFDYLKVLKESIGL